MALSAFPQEWSPGRLSDSRRRPVRRGSCAPKAGHNMRPRRHLAFPRPSKDGFKTLVSTSLCQTTTSSFDTDVQSAVHPAISSATYVRHEKEPAPGPRTSTGPLVSLDHTFVMGAGPHRLPAGHRIRRPRRAGERRRSRTGVTSAGFGSRIRAGPFRGQPEWDPRGCIFPARDRPGTFRGRETAIPALFSSAPVKCCAAVELTSE